MLSVFYSDLWRKKYCIITSKVWSYGKKFHRMRATNDFKCFSFQNAACSKEMKGVRGCRGLKSSPPPMTGIIIEIQHSTLSSLTQWSLHSIASCVCACCFNLSFLVLFCSHKSLPALFWFIYKECIELRQIITDENKLTKVKIYIALNSELRINTDFENTLIDYSKSVKLTKRSVLLT